MLSRVFRHRVASWVQPLAVRLPVDANTLTALGIAAAAFAGFLFATGRFPLAALAMALSGSLDILDGGVARARGVAGKKGGLFDSIADRISDNLVYAGIFLHYVGAADGNAAALVATFTAASASNVASYIKSRSEAAGLTCDVGIFRRQERFVVLIVAALFGSERFVAALVVLAFFAIESMLSRFLHAYRRASTSNP